MPAHIQAAQRVTNAYFQHLASHGWMPIRVFDGEERHKVKTAIEAMEWIFNLDEASVAFDKVMPDGRRVWHWTLFIPGNGAEIISDHSCSADDDFAALNEPDAFDPERFV